MPGQLNPRKLTVDLQLAQLDPPQVGGVGSVGGNAQVATRPISNYSIASKSSTRSKGLNQFTSPDRRAANALQQASEYKEKMISRVNYLAKEEQKFLKKIQKTRSNAERQAHVKEEKIAQL